MGPDDRPIPQPLWRGRLRDYGFLKPTATFLLFRPGGPSSAAQALGAAGREVDADDCFHIGWGGRGGQAEGGQQDGKRGSQHGWVLSTRWAMDVTCPC